MADVPFRIKVDKELYQTTLNQLKAQLDKLNDHKENLERQIETLESGDTFSGSDVKEALNKAKEALERVKDAISRVAGYQATIQQQLTGVEQAATQLTSSIAGIDLPNMFN